MVTIKIMFIELTEDEILEAVTKHVGENMYAVNVQGVEIDWEKRIARVQFAKKK